MTQNHTPNPNIDRPEAQDRTRLTAGGSINHGATEFSVGEVIGGDYQVLMFIGAGGMGNVYSVRHTIMHEEYALKTLSADKVTEVAWRRFQNEAQAIARMSHPNIVRIYNLGLHNGHLPYYVMDLLKGQALSDLLRDQGPLELTLALSLFIEMTAGFGYAHKKGIVHRDIKPANVVLLDTPEPSCRVKIVDFGIAKLSGVKDPQNQYLTNVGEVCGSPYYMSPEQTEGQRIDARSDIYSLGCTLFELLTGAPPLRGRSAVDTMLLHQTTVPPTLKAASGGKEFPEMLEQVMATLLAKAPMDRYQTMELVNQDLSIILGGDHTAINPYTTQSPKAISMQDAADRAARRTQTGLSQGETFTHRRQFSTGEDEEEDDDEEMSPGSRAPLMLIVCALASLLLLAAGAGLWWHFKAPPTLAKASVSSSFEDDAFKTGPEQFSEADRVIHRHDYNSDSAALSANDTKPFCHLKMIQGQLYKVFEFPDDITIGDITFNKLGEVPAKGTRAVIANDYITFAPDQVLVKHPQYLSRFKPGDFHGLKIAGLYASDPLLKLVCKFPQVDRLQLDECPNITSMAVKYIDAMPALIDFEVGQHTLNAEALSHMTRLKSLKRVGFCYRSDSESFLKLLKGSQTVQMLTLNRSMVTRQGFEYVATLPNLEQLILSSARFTSADLQPLAKLKKLKAICITEHAVDPNLILALRSIRSLKMVEFTEKRASPISDDRVASELPGVRVLWQANMNEALNPKLEFGTP